jgi:uncharacterized protein
VAKFKIYCANLSGDRIETFEYDNSISKLFDSNGNLVTADLGEIHRNNFGNVKDAFIVSENNPAKKSRDFRRLKISLGLKCNYSCEYCSQRFIPHENENPVSKTESFLDKIYKNFDFGLDGSGKKIEFWGGEPLLYWDTILPIAKSLKENFPKIIFSIITNGSLLTKEKVDILDELGFYISISHDGPGQSVRGPDPLEIPKIKETWLYAYSKLKPKGMMSFNPMLNAENPSRKKIVDFFVELTNDSNVSLGEGDFVSAYDEGGVSMSLSEDNFKSYSLNAFKEIATQNINNFIIIPLKITDFLGTLFNSIPSRVLGQKCGMDTESQIAVDLDGNVLTCQNVSSIAIAPNKNSHKIGHIDDFDNIKLNTATHWSERKECSNCPVLQICKGSCMFLQEELWDISCNNSYYDNIPYFASVIHHLTEYVPIYIDGDLPEDRKDIFGFFENKEFSVENFNKEIFLEHIGKPFTESIDALEE